MASTRGIPERASTGRPRILTFAMRLRMPKKYYSESFRMAPLAYVAFPNADLSTSYALTNTIADATSGRILRAFVADDPRPDLPLHVYPSGDFPAFLMA